MKKVKTIIEIKEHEAVLSVLCDTSVFGYPLYIVDLAPNYENTRPELLRKTDPDYNPNESYYLLINKGALLAVKNFNKYVRKIIIEPFK